LGIGVFEGTARLWLLVKNDSTDSSDKATHELLAREYDRYFWHWNSIHQHEQLVLFISFAA
jgi:hypothetical protein